MVVVQAPEVVRAEGSLEMDQRAHCAAGHAEALRLEGAGPRAPLPSLHCCFSKCPPPGSSVLSHSSLGVWNWALTAPGRLPAIVLSKDWLCKVLQCPHLWEGMVDTDGISVPHPISAPSALPRHQPAPFPHSILLRTQEHTPQNPSSKITGGANGFLPLDFSLLPGCP